MSLTLLKSIFSPAQNPAGLFVKSENIPTSKKTMAITKQTTAKMIMLFINNILPQTKFFYKSNVFFYSPYFIYNQLYGKNYMNFLGRCPTIGALL